ncbi:MAG: VCBS repeat-containing protein [Myxococcota bacterium]
MRARSRGPHRRYRPSRWPWLAGASLGLLAGCFSTESTVGLPCSSDASCGSGNTCVFGYCRAEGFDAQARCGDGVQEQGEFCYPDDRKVQVTLVGELLDAVWADLDGNGTTDSITLSRMGMSSAYEIAVSFNNGDGTYEEDDSPDFIVRSSVLPDIGVDIEEPPDVFVNPVNFTVGDFVGNPLPDLVLAVAPVSELPEQLQDQPAAETLLRSLWLAENIDSETFELSPYLVPSPEADIQVDASDLLPTGLRRGDFNGDGRPDLLLLPRSEDGATMNDAYVVLTGDDDDLEDPTPVALGSRGLPFIADLYGDGTDDLTTPDDMLTAISIVLGPIVSDMDPRPPARISTQSLVVNLDAGDVDGDGNTDLVTGYDSGGFEVWLGDGRGQFASVGWVTDANANDLAVIDIDGDALPEVLTVNSRGLFVHPGYGNGLYGGGFQISTELADLLQVQQLDDDGLPDLVLGSPNVVSLLFAWP